LKVERDCSEEKLKILARALAGEIQAQLRPGMKAILCLEGELGAGKSTFAGQFISALKTNSAQNHAAGSPTYALMQSEKISNALSVHHGDLYRLKSETEIFEAGIESMIWTPEPTRAEIFLLEWCGLWPGFSAELHARRGFPEDWVGMDLLLKHSSSNPEGARDLELSTW